MHSYFKLKNKYLSLLLACLNNADHWNSIAFKFKYYLKLITSPISSHKYIKFILSLNDQNTFLLSRSLLPIKIHRPYLNNKFNKRQRFNIISFHYTFIQNLPNLQLKDILLSNNPKTLTQFVAKNNSIIEIKCSPYLFDREGENSLVFYYNGQAITMLTFTFCRLNSKIFTYIGALQGLSSNEIIKEASKACYGLFPKRILYEALTILVESVGISKIYAIKNELHPLMNWQYKRKKSKVFFADYDTFWKSINGIEHQYGFKLPTKIERKSIEDIASKKRSEYKNRYKLLDFLRDNFKTNLNEISDHDNHSKLP